MTPVNPDPIEEANELIERCMRSLNEIKRGIHRYKFCSDNKCPALCSKNPPRAPRTPCKYSVVPRKQSTNSIGPVIDTVQSNTKPDHNEIERPKTKRGGSRSPSTSNINTGEDVGTGSKKQVLVCNIDTCPPIRDPKKTPNKSPVTAITGNEDEKILKLLHMLQSISDTDTASCSSECSTVCGAAAQKEKEKIYKEFDIEEINKTQQNTGAEVTISPLEDGIRPPEKDSVISSAIITSEDGADKCSKNNNSKETLPPNQAASCSIECCDIIGNISVFKVPERSPGSMSNTSLFSEKHHSSLIHSNAQDTSQTNSAQSHHQVKSFIYDECKPSCKKISGHCHRVVQSPSIASVAKSVERVLKNENIEPDKDEISPETIPLLTDQAETSNYNEEKNTGTCRKTGICQKKAQPPPPPPPPPPMIQNILDSQKAPSNGNHKKSDQETERKQPDTSTITSASATSEVTVKSSKKSSEDSAKSERTQNSAGSETTSAQSERDRSISCGPIRSPYPGAKYESNDAEKSDNASKTSPERGSNREPNQSEEDNHKPESQQSIVCRCTRPQCPRERIKLRCNNEEKIAPTDRTSTSTETASKKSETSPSEARSDKEPEQTGSIASDESKIVQSLNSETSPGNDSDGSKTRSLTPELDLPSEAPAASLNDAPASPQSNVDEILKSTTTQTEEDKIGPKNGCCPFISKLGETKHREQESVAVQSYDCKSQETQSLQVDLESVASQSEEVNEESEAQTEEPDPDDGSIHSDDFCRYATASYGEGYFEDTSPRSRPVPLEENEDPSKEADDMLIPVVMELASEVSSQVFVYPFEQEEECACLPSCETPTPTRDVTKIDEDASCRDKPSRNLVIQQLPPININSRFTYQGILRYWTELNGVLIVEATREANIGYEEVLAEAAPTEGDNEKSSTDISLDAPRSYHVQLNEEEQTASLGEPDDYNDSIIFQNEVLESYQVLEATSDIRTNEDVSIRLPESALDNIEVYQTYLDPSVIIEPMLDSPSLQSESSEESGSDKDRRISCMRSKKQGKHKCSTPKQKYSLLIIPHLQYNFKHVPVESREVKKTTDPYKIGFYQDEAVQFPEENIQPEPVKPSTAPSNNEAPVRVTAAAAASSEFDYSSSSSSTSVSSDDSGSKIDSSLKQVGETDKMVQISLTSPEGSSSDETVNKSKSTADEGKTINEFLTGLTEQSKKDLDYYQSHGELPQLDVQSRSNAYMRTPISFSEGSIEVLDEGAQMLVNLVKSPNRRGTSTGAIKIKPPGQVNSRTFSGVSDDTAGVKRSIADSNKEAASGNASSSNSRKKPGSSLVEYCLIEPHLPSEQVKEKSSSPLYESGRSRRSSVVKKISHHPVKEDVAMNEPGRTYSQLVEEDANEKSVKRRRRSISHYRKLLMKHDLEYNLSDSLTNDLSEGELYCKCSLSHGEVHTCPLAKKAKLKTKFSKRFEKSLSFLKRQFAEPNQVLMQRAMFTNWVSYYVMND